MHALSRSRHRAHAALFVTFAVPLLLTLGLLGACANPSDAPELGADSDLSEQEDLQEGLQEGLQARTRPLPPEFTEAELGALAETPAVRALNEPFGNAPPPSRSQFVTMQDGTRLAVSLYFPAGFDDRVDKAPSVYVESWYGRAVEATGTAIDLYRAGGFVVALVDPRGFGASFGWQTAFMTADVRRDEKAMLAWLTSQGWSNGKVAAVGLSISASHAEAVAASGVPTVKAAVVRAGDFDHYVNNIFPGGVPNLRMMGFVSFITDWMRGEPCVADLSTCSQAGVAPVDGDADYTVLQAAFRDHQANLRGEVLQSLVNRDDGLGTGTVDDLSTVGKVDDLRRAAVPARISASWMDGTTAHSALTRFAAMPDVPMELAIGATTHSGGLDADPFSRKEPFRAARPGAVEQYGADVAFVKKVLSGQPIGRSVSYVALGTGIWKTTPVWPPAGVTVEALQLTRTELVVSPTRIKAAERTYQVDPTVSTGAHFNRWDSQGGKPVYYGDRRSAPGRRLSFDGAPVRRDMELVGDAELCLAMRTDQSDGVVFAYLEDVAPDGRVTYLTEGELRLLHRKTTGDNTRVGGCDPAPGTKRTFNRIDAAPVTPGELMHVELPFLPTAARIQKGHRLRLTLAGADAGNFPLLTEAPATWSIGYGGAGGSTLRVPMKAWSPR